MAPLQQYLVGSRRDLWLSSFDVYPSKLFEGAKQRLTILLVSNHESQQGSVWTTRYIRWRPDERMNLFPLVAYGKSYRDATLNVLPKTEDMLAASILRKLRESKGAAFASATTSPIYVHRIPYNYVKAIDFIPYFWNERDGEKKSEDYKPYCLIPRTANLPALAIINSNLFFFRWYSLFEGYHCGRHEITSFPFGFPHMTADTQNKLETLAGRLMSDLKENSSRKTARYNTNSG